jgi:hypothetical protein
MRSRCRRRLLILDSWYPGAEVLEADGGFGQQLPHDRQHGVADGDDGAFLAAAAGQPPIAVTKEGIGARQRRHDLAEGGRQPWVANARITPARAASRSPRPYAISRSSATAASTSSGFRLAWREAVPAMIASTQATSTSAEPSSLQAPHSQQRRPRIEYRVRPGSHCGHIADRLVDLCGLVVADMTGRLQRREVALFRLPVGVGVLPGAHQFGGPDANR